MAHINTNRNASGLSRKAAPEWFNRCRDPGKGMGHEIIGRRPTHFPVLVRLLARHCLLENGRGLDCLHQDGASDIVTLYVSY